jgi:hypothetical protein
MLAALVTTIAPAMAASMFHSRVMARPRSPRPSVGRSLGHRLKAWWPTLRLMGRESVGLLLLVAAQASILIGFGLALSTL